MKLTPLPEAPATLGGPVKAWREPIVLPTYEPAPAERNPMFLEKRVFQGSSGRVYPLPVHDRIETELIEKAWDAIHIENAFVRVTVLPELGGRIYAAVDRINGVDIIYRNRVIKPALVGLAGPWISGGIEFNWPQHHRPSTTMPTLAAIEEEADGARTIWLSEHEPMNRMKGMHGVRLTAGSSAIELRVRLHNRTDLRQTFLWWANVATDVHEHYQSFFPEDATFIADHAKRAMSAFPFCEGRYYGVDYAGRAADGVPERERPARFRPTGEAAPNDLRWYANIPVPTSYMCLGSTADFFGGYDHRAEAGIVHVADHAIAPGKKQWTWGNHDFGYAWDRNLTEPDDDGVHHPYIELMAGVFTDNQPDFSFLEPGETKTFTQVWYPIRAIGPAVAATFRAAIGLRTGESAVRVGVQATVRLDAARVTVTDGAGALVAWEGVLDPATPLVLDVPAADPEALAGRLAITVTADGAVVAERLPPAGATGEIPAPASEPPPPEAIGSVDELYVTGLHLDQYRHATRAPEAYWREALRRDPADSRCNTALGDWHLRRGEFGEAVRHLETAIGRMTLRNPNPPDGTAHYLLGLAERLRGRPSAARKALAKAAWNAATAGPAALVLAEFAAADGDDATALAHVETVLGLDGQQLRARNLAVMLLRRLGRDGEAEALLAETLAFDPLDPWALDLAGRPVAADDAMVLDLALDLARAGDPARALDRLDGRLSARGPLASPMLAYHAAAIADRIGRSGEAARFRGLARQASSDYCFPARLEDIAVLEAAMAADPADPKAPSYLGNLLYDRRRHREAIALWERSVAIDPSFSIPWRNLGIGVYNILGEPDRAAACYDAAIRAAPDDARLTYERDQLWKRIGRPPAERLAALEARPDHVRRRDDLSVELADLYNQLGRPAEALAVMAARRFQPWEGGEGMALGQWVRTQLKLGALALDAGDAAAASRAFEAALHPPESLGEARHLFANASDIHYWIGVAAEAAGDPARAAASFEAAAETRGDFLGMSVRIHSDKTLWAALALRRLGRGADADRLAADLADHARSLFGRPATIDYFATSLPTMLLFEEDLDRRQAVDAVVMLGAAALAAEDTEAARRHLREALARDPNQAVAADLLALFCGGPHDEGEASRPS